MDKKNDAMLFGESNKTAINLENGKREKRKKRLKNNGLNLEVKLEMDERMFSYWMKQLPFTLHPFVTPPFHHCLLGVK